MKEIRSLLLLTMKVYFFILILLLFSFGLIKFTMTTAMIFFSSSSFFLVTFLDAAPFFLASSICLCHNASFISNLHNKKKFKGENA